MIKCIFEKTYRSRTYKILLQTRSFSSTKHNSLDHDSNNSYSVWSWRPSSKLLFKQSPLHSPHALEHSSRFRLQLHRWVLQLPLQWHLTILRSDSGATGKSIVIGSYLPLRRHQPLVKFEIEIEIFWWRPSLSGDLTPFPGSECWRLLICLFERSNDHVESKKPSIAICCRLSLFWRGASFTGLFDLGVYTGRGLIQGD